MERRFSKRQPRAKIYSSTTGLRLNDKSDFLPGGTMSMVWGRIRNLVNKENMPVNNFGFWNLFQITGKHKSILVLTFYRIPKTSSRGPITMHHQLNCLTGLI